MCSVAVNASERLIGPHRKEDQRDAEGERSDDCARAAVADHELALRQDLIGWDEPLDPDVRRLGPEFGGIDLSPDGDDNVCVERAEPSQNAVKEVARLLMKIVPKVK